MVCPMTIEWTLEPETETAEQRATAEYTAMHNVISFMQPHRGIARIADTHRRWQSEQVEEIKAAQLEKNHADSS